MDIQYNFQHSNLDGVYYACSICSIPLININTRWRFPDELCQKCHRATQGMRDEPWLRLLIRIEKARRKREALLRRDSIPRDLISYEQYMFMAERDDDDGAAMDIELDHFDDIPGEDPLED